MLQKGLRFIASDTAEQLHADANGELKLVGLEDWIAANPTKDAFIKIDFTGPGQRQGSWTFSTMATCVRAVCATASRTAPSVDVACILMSTTHPGGSCLPRRTGSSTSLQTIFLHSR